MTIKKSFKSQVQKFTKMRLSANASYQIVNQKEKRSALISFSTTQLTTSNPSQDKQISIQKQFNIITKINQNEQQVTQQDDECNTLTEQKLYSVKLQQQDNTQQLQRQAQSDNQDRKFEKEGDIKQEFSKKQKDICNKEVNQNMKKYCSLQSESYSSDESTSQVLLKTNYKIIDEQKSYIQSKTNEFFDCSMKVENENLTNQLLQHQEFISLQNEFEYNFQSYQKSKQDGEEQVIVIERQLKQDISDRINQNYFNNHNFQNQKSDIFALLKNQNLFFCKLLYSNEKGDLFIGYEQLDNAQYNNQIIKVRYLPTDKELQQDTSVMQALSFNNYSIKTKDTYIQVLPLDECKQVKQKQQQFLMEILPYLSFYKNKQYLEISIKNKESCKTQKIREQIDFLFTSLKDSKYYLCEFYDQDIKGILVQANYRNFNKSREIRIVKEVRHPQPQQQLRIKNFPN
ncbi:hypothetical protein ABPG72_021194 [Tetrahymena utriculariae]